MQIGDRIKLMRNYLGMTQYELVGDDYSTAYVSKVENGSLIPSDEFILLVSERLKVAESFLTWDPMDGEKEIEEMIERVRHAGKLSQVEKHTLYLLSFEQLSTKLLLSIFSILIKESIQHEPIEHTMRLIKRSLQRLPADLDHMSLESTDRDELTEYMMMCGNGYFARQFFYEADYFYRKAERILPDQHSLQAARLYYNLSLTKQRLTEHYDLALYYAEKSLEIFKMNGAESDFYDVLITKAVQLHLSGRYQESLQCLERAEQYFAAKQDLIKLEMIIFNKGRAYQGLGETQKAIHFFHQTLSMQDHLRHEKGKAYSYRALAQIYVDRKEFQFADECIRSGLFLANQFELSYLECEFRALKAQIFQLKGLEKWYTKTIQSVIDDCIHFNYFHLAATLAVQHGNYLYQMHKYKQASDYYQLALQLKEKGGSQIEKNDSVSTRLL